MEACAYTTHHLVKNSDLNHHGTLYAGRCAEWFVESGFTAAASLTKPANIVCLKIHSMHFSQPAWPGDILCFESKVVHAGRTSLVSHISVMKGGKLLLDGFITFIHVDARGKPIPHGIQLNPTSPEDIRLQREASQLK